MPTTIAITITITFIIVAITVTEEVLNLSNTMPLENILEPLSDLHADGPKGPLVLPLVVLLEEDPELEAVLGAALL